MADSEAKVRWDRENTVQVKLKLNKRTDADILAYLDSIPNKQGYIKELIREDIRQAVLAATISYKEEPDA